MTTNSQDLLNIGGGEDGNGAANNTGNTNTAPNTGATLAPSSNTTNTNTGTTGDSAPTDTNNGKDFGKNWRDYIPEELKDRGEWANIKDVSDLYKNYINAQQTISKSVRIPDASSSPEDVANFYARLGKPKSKDEYTFEYKPAKAEYTAYNKDSFNFDMFKDIADAANLTADQYQKLASAYIDIANDNFINYNETLKQNAASELKAAEQKLRTDWGDKYTQNINMITEKVKALYPKDTLVRMQNAGLFRDADFLKSHLKLTKMMTGDTVFLEGNVVENVPQTLQTLQEKRDRLMREDYTKNKEQVLALNQQIVNLKKAQASGAAKFIG